MVIPSFQTRTYNTKDVARIKDRYQQYLYLKYGAYPVDMYVSGEDLIMLFNKDETKDLYEKYRARELV